MAEEKEFFRFDRRDAVDVIFDVCLKKSTIISVDDNILLGNPGYLVDCLS
jgi:hypothetical protein